MDNMFQTGVDKFKVGPKCAEKLQVIHYFVNKMLSLVIVVFYCVCQVDIRSIAIAGYAAASATQQISTEAFLGDKAVYALANFEVVKRFLDTPDKIKRFEKIIDEHGLEHLITVRYISGGQWKDYNCWRVCDL